MRDLPVDVLRKYIDWTFFFYSWGLQASWPGVMTHEKYGEAAAALYDDAQRMLDRLVGKILLRSAGHFHAKFVIADPQDVQQVLDLQRTHHIPPSRIYLMAEGTDSETLRAREKWLAALCIEHGFRLSDRLHIHLFGDTRGT